MRFYVIYKPQTANKSVVKVEGDEIKTIEDVSYSGSPFMIVAAEPVAAGEIYQAILINENKVQLNYKPGKDGIGHKFVNASSLAEALEIDPTPEQGQGGNTPDSTPDPEPTTPAVGDTISFTSYADDKETVHAHGTAEIVALNTPEGFDKVTIITNETIDANAADWTGREVFVGAVDANGFRQLYYPTVEEAQPVYIKVEA